MVRVHLVNIGSFDPDDSTGITFINLFKLEVFVLDVLPFSRYTVMLVVEMSFEVSKSIFFMSSFSFFSSTFILASSLWEIKLFYMVSLSTKLIALLSLELDLWIGT